MTESSIEIRKLAPDLMQDFLLFFDGEAFADNPKWGFCFCQFLYVDHAKVTSGYSHHAREPRCSLRANLRQPNGGLPRVPRRETRWLVQCGASHNDGLLRRRARPRRRSNRTDHMLRRRQAASALRGCNLRCCMQPAQD